MARNAMEEIFNDDDLVMGRKALLRNGGKKSAPDIISKREVEFTPDRGGDIDLHATRSEMVTFTVSGEEVLDAQQSFFQLSIQTNNYTPLLKGSVTALIKSIRVTLPNASGLEIERIDEYSDLDTAVHLVSCSSQQLESGWNSGLHMINNVRSASKRAESRRFLNCGQHSITTLTFQIRHGFLAVPYYIPLKALKGIQIEVELNPIQSAFVWNPANEANDRVFNEVDFKFINQNEYNALDAGGQAQVRADMAAYYGRNEDPNHASRQNLQVRITNFSYHCMMIEMSERWHKAYADLGKSQAGTNLLFDSYEFVQVEPVNSHRFTHTFTKQFQNLQSVLFFPLDAGQVRGRWRCRTRRRAS